MTAGDACALLGRVLSTTDRLLVPLGVPFAFIVLLERLVDPAALESAAGSYTEELTNVAWGVALVAAATAFTVLVVRWRWSPPRARLRLGAKLLVMVVYVAAVSGFLVMWLRNHDARMM